MRSMIGYFFKSIMTDMLNGYKFTLPGQMGMQCFVMANRDYTKYVPDWKTSMQNKKDIVARGGTPKSKDNPDGERWAVPYMDATYPLLVWEKKHCMARNKSAYRFDLGVRATKRLHAMLRDNKVTKIVYTTNKQTL
jgi:hypothetical protein